MIEFQAKFEDFPLGDELLSGEIAIRGDEWHWDPKRVWVYAGNDGSALVPVHEDLARQIRDYFTARSGWLAMVDAEHQSHLPAPKRTPRLVPAWAEGV